MELFQKPEPAKPRKTATALRPATAALNGGLIPNSVTGALQPDISMSVNNVFAPGSAGFSAEGADLAGGGEVFREMRRHVAELALHLLGALDDLLAHVMHGQDGERPGGAEETSAGDALWDAPDEEETRDDDRWCRGDWGDAGTGRPISAPRLDLRTEPWAPVPDLVKLEPLNEP